jgi:hypothetical protein
MMNPNELYKSTLEATEQALKIYCCWLRGNKAFGEVQTEEMPRYADADYIIYFDYKFEQYVEVKTRLHWWGKFPQEKIPFRKYCFAYTVKKLWNRNTIYLLKASNKIGFLDLTEPPDRVDELIARYDRGEEKDLYAFYSIGRFRMIHDY